MEVTTEMLLRARFRPDSLTSVEKDAIEKAAAKEKFGDLTPSLVMSSSDFTATQIAVVMKRLKDAGVENGYILKSDHYTPAGVKFPAGSGVLLT